MQHCVSNWKILSAIVGGQFYMEYKNPAFYHRDFVAFSRDFVCNNRTTFTLRVFCVVVTL